MAPLWRGLLGLVVAVVQLSLGGAQNYDYGYPEYGGVGGNEQARGGGLVRAGFGGGLAGFVAGQVWYRMKSRWVKTDSDKAKKKLKKDFASDYDKIKDLAMLRLKELEYSCDAVDRVIEQLENTLHSPLTDESKRKRAEFKLPDANNDDLISRSEFNNYLKSYFAAHPELADMEYPTFDDFDTDSDGLVTFPEWKQFITQLEAQAEREEEKRIREKARSY